MALRVLHVHDSLSVGGIETWLARLPRYVGDEVELWYGMLAEEGELAGEAREAGAEVVRVGRVGPRWVPDTLAYGLALGGLLRRLRPDIVHVHQEGPVAAAVVGRAMARVPARIVAHRHNRPYAEKGSRLYRLERWAARHVDLFVCCSDFVRRAHVEHYGIAEERTAVVYPAVPPEWIGRAGEREASRRAVGVPEGAVAFVFVGRLAMEHKGLDVLVGAVGRLAARRGDFVVLLAGGGPDRERVEEMVAERGLGGVVKVLGYVEDLHSVLGAGDVYVQPSRWEGLPLSLLEAMAAGLPPVATAVGGVPEAVEDGVCGILVPPEDEEALARAMEAMIEDAGRRRAMGEAAKERVREEFSMDVAAERLVGLYRRLVGEGR